MERTMIPGISSSIFLNLLFNGFFLGSIYALVGAGLTLVFGVTRLVNFAHSILMVSAMYFSYYIWSVLGVEPFLLLPLSFPLFFLVGYLIYRFLIKFVVDQSFSSQVLATLGLFLIIQYGIVMLWTSNTYTVNSPLRNIVFRFDGVFISLPHLLTFLTTLAISFALYYFLKTTYIGRAIRATAQDPEAAKILGIETNYIYSISLGLGTGLAAVAGNMLAMSYSIDPYIADVFLVMAFVVIIMGGMGNYIGAILAGYIIGMLEVFTAFFFLPLLKHAVPLLLLIIILIFKPEGLLSRRLRA
ncbi:MAG: branched-chain amino acid ABC transporter permease [Candidatus Caldarchaeum sp.]|nr:branched-chain amino acid ABC transporter permease [Candidatus Caldarchaeum sp.]